MKEVKLLFFALFAFIMCGAVTSCSSDDDEIEGGSVGVVGAWRNSGDDDIFVFNSDGTFVTYYNESYYSRGEKGEFGTWKTSQKTLSLSWKGYYDEEDGTTHEYDPETDNWEIAEMSNDIIKLKYLGGAYLAGDYNIGDSWVLSRYSK